MTRSRLLQLQDSSEIETVLNLLLFERFPHERTRYKGITESCGTSADEQAKRSTNPIVGGEERKDPEDKSAPISIVHRDLETGQDCSIEASAIHHAQDDEERKERSKASDNRVHDDDHLAAGTSATSKDKAGVMYGQSSPPHGQPQGEAVSTETTEIMNSGTIFRGQADLLLKDLFDPDPKNDAAVRRALGSVLEENLLPILAHEGIVNPILKPESGNEQHGNSGLSPRVDESSTEEAKPVPKIRHMRAFAESSPMQDSSRHPATTTRGGLSLSDLEQEVSDHFAKSIVARKALSSKNTSYFAAKGIETDLQSSKIAKPHSQMSRLGSTRKTDSRTRSFIGEYGFEPFSLVYNECSMVALSQWSILQTNQSRRKSSRYVPVPCPKPSFRSCSFCGLWGHYDMECQRLSNAQTISLSKEISAQISLATFVDDEAGIVDANGDAAAQEAGRHSDSSNSEAAMELKGTQVPNTAAELSLDVADNVLEPDKGADAKFTECEICGSSHVGEALLVCDGCDRLFHITCLDPPLSSVPDGDWFCASCEGYNSEDSSVVDIEGCGDFIIEQRKRKPAELIGQSLLSHSLGIDVDFEGWHAGIGVADSKSLSVLYPESNDDPTNSNVKLSEGEFCWAKRKHAPLGKPGRDEWWPSQVLVVVDDRRHDRHFDRKAFSRYTVRMLALTGASRVRASSVLPFFDHFEHVGYHRVMKIKAEKIPTQSDVMFRRAVEDTLLELGFKSLNQALARSRELTSGRPSKKQKISRKPLVSWEGCDETVLDGFVVYAKEDDAAEATKGRPSKEKSQQQSSSATARPPASLTSARSHRGSFSGWMDDFRSARLSRSIVAWFVKSDSAGGTQVNQDMKVGVVLAAVIDQRKALVQPLQNWETALLDRRPSSTGVVGVDLSGVGSCTWIDFKKLHLVSNGLRKSLEGTFMSKILPASLEIARERASLDFGRSFFNSMSTRTAAAPARVPDDKAASDEKSSAEHSSDSPTPSPKVAMAENDDRKTAAGMKSDKAEVGAQPSPPLPAAVLLPASVVEASDQQVVESDDDATATDQSLQDEEEAREDGDDDSDFVAPPERKAEKTDDDESSSVAEYLAEGSEEDNVLPEGVYQIAQILDERKASGGVGSGSEYLIKWKGFPVEESTWEPERNILNKSFVNFYKCEKLEEQLKATSEYTKQTASVTRTMVEALRYRKEELEKELIQMKPRGEETATNKQRVCPFCLTSKNVMALAGHMKAHCNEPNYEIIREAARLIQPDWYQKKDKG